MRLKASGEQPSASGVGRTGKACLGMFAAGAFLSASGVQAQEGPQFHSSSGEQAGHGDDDARTADQRAAALLERLESRLDDQERRIADLERTVGRQADEIASRDQELRTERMKVQRLNLALAERDRSAASQVPRFQTAQATTAVPDAQDPVVEQPPASAPDEQVAQNDGSNEAERPQSDRAVDQLLLDQGGVLLPKGKLQIEPSIDYTSISSDRVNISGFSIFDAIIIGTIRVDDVNRDILTGAVTARYGTGNRTQVDLRVPYVYRNDTEATGIGTGDALERNITGHGLGDLGLTFAWQALSNRGAQPATIFRVQAEIPTGKSAFEIERVAPEEDSPERILTEAPTGSGFYTISPGVTFVWPLDPVVLFAGGAFNYTFDRSFEEFGNIEPGHGFEFFTGMNMSINQLVSMNFSFLDKQRFATRSNGTKIPGSGTHDARLSLGASIGLSDRTSLVVSTAAGLTDESPDFSFSLRVPITF